MRNSVKLAISCYCRGDVMH